MTVAVRNAATVVLLRDGDDSVEVVLLERNAHSGFVPGAHLFPGGAVDDDDSLLVERSVRSTDELAVMIGRPDAATFAIAAIRECFEEFGVMLATHDDGSPLEPAALAFLEDDRAQLHGGGLEFADLCATTDLRLATDELTYLSHWITPEGAPRRYDTRFFVARQPEGQAGHHDGIEAVAHRWVEPATALEHHANGDWPMIQPTVRTLVALDALAEADATADAVWKTIDEACHAPDRIDDQGGTRVVLPYDQAGRP